MARVKNVPDTSGLKPECGCDDWTNHWEKITKTKATECVVIGCKEDVSIVGVHGGHVHRADFTSKDSPMYIIPLCPTHNNHNNTEVMNVSESHLVPAAKLKSCNN